MTELQGRLLKNNCINEINLSTQSDLACFSLRSFNLNNSKKAMASAVVFFFWHHTTTVHLHRHLHQGHATVGSKVYGFMPRDKHSSGSRFVKHAFQRLRDLHDTIPVLA